MTNENLDSLLPDLRDPKKRSKAFSEVVRLTSRRLYNHIRHMVLVHDDANDVLQNTYLKAWRSLETFRGDSQISTWLFRIATNETLTFLANQRVRNISSSLEFEQDMLMKMEADTYYEGDEMSRLFQQAILSLPEKQRQVFNLRYYDDMKYEEMSKVTGTSEGALKASYHIAVKKIEQYIKEYAGEPERKK